MQMIFIIDYIRIKGDLNESKARKGAKGFSFEY